MLKQLLCAALTGVALWTAAAERQDLWTIETSDFKADYSAPTVANGVLGLLPGKGPFEVDYVMVNNLYDADPNSQWSVILKTLNPFSMILKIDGKTVEREDMKDWKQTLNMRQGMLTTQFEAFGKVKVQYDLMALRNMAYAGMILVKVEALKDVNIEAVTHVEIPEGYYPRKRDFHHLNADGLDCNIAHARGTTELRKQHIETASTFLYQPGRDVEPEYVWDTHELCYPDTLKKGQEVTFALVANVIPEQDFNDPYNEAERQIIYAQHEGYDRLLKRHKEAWDELWQGDIEIEGDDDAQRAVRLALYCLYSSDREGTDLSIAPAGLSSQVYSGHIFWDTETWMYPPMLLLNPGIATSMVNYRFNRLDAARRKAASYGYRGVMFPWESDHTGNECTPTQAVCGVTEQHITSDVAMAAWNYYCVSGDRRWLADKGYPLLRDVADFWVSRAERNDDGSWSINGVVGADEYKAGANDNAFTNGGAKTTLWNAVKAAKLLGETPDPRWQVVADGLRICQFPDGTTREHSTYNGEKIKQADVNLLGYPLQIVNDPEAMRRDLAYYEHKIDPVNGPAMSNAVLAVQYARLGDGKKAYELFQRSYKPNERAPFGIMAETATNQSKTFMTGEGGMLQAVLNGFGGLQVTDDGIQQLPSALPPHWKSLTIKGVGPDRRTYTNTAH